jgi:hypothetical protein
MEPVGRGKARHQPLRDPRGDGEDHRFVRGDGLRALSPVEARHAVALERQRAQALAQFGPRAMARQPAKRRVDEGFGKAGHGDARVQRLAPARDGFAQDIGGQPQRAFARRRVEHGEQHGIEQALPQRAMGGNHRRNRHIGALHQFCERGIVGQPRARHPARGHGHPPGQRAFVHPQGPARPIAQVVEGEAGGARPGERRRRADRGAEAGHRTVAREDEVVAIVDHFADLAVVIRAAAPASLPRALVERNGQARAGELHRARQPGKTTANDRSAGKRGAAHRRIRARQG